MSFETGAPPPPPPLPDQLPIVVHVQDQPQDGQLQDGRGAPLARPALGHDAGTAVLMGPPPGTRTYVLRATGTTETTD